MRCESHGLDATHGCPKCRAKAYVDHALAAADRFLQTRGGDDPLELVTLSVATVRLLLARAHLQWLPPSSAVSREFMEEALESKFGKGG